ncbi:MAG: YkgJ family cysteine cluster protein [Polyangiaceae bacterium]
MRALRETRESDGWAASSERAQLLAIYGTADALFEGWTCACGLKPDCCHFGVTGREPYPTAVELAEVRFAVRAAGFALRRPQDVSRGGRRLPGALDERRCPLLSHDGRCRIYASRPFGCRTHFCDRATAPWAARTKPPRDALRELGARIADLSARFAPRDPRPRPLVRALEGT